MADSGDDERLLLFLLLFILIRRSRRLQRNQTQPHGNKYSNGKKPRKLQPYNSMILTNENIKQNGALSLKGTGNKFFDWLIIPLPIPIPFTLFSLDRKRREAEAKSEEKETLLILLTPIPSSFRLRFRFRFLIYTGS